MSVIITGATGFVGKNLISFLLGKGVEISPLSIRGSEWIKNFPKFGTAVIHLAGMAHDTSNTSDADAYFKVNRDLTIKLFDLFMRSEIRDFFYFSSVKAVADTVDGVLTEEERANPKTPYGQSKMEAENYLLKQELPEGKRLFIIRPCMIHGPGNKGNLNLLYSVVEKGLPWPLAAFHNQRSFLCIDNLNFLIESMLNNTKVKSGIYNFADDTALSTNELVTLIAQSFARAPKLWKVPASLVKTLVKIGDVLPIPLNSERLKKLTESYVVSNQKIKKELGLEQLPFTVQEGLNLTIASFRN